MARRPAAWVEWMQGAFAGLSAVQDTEAAAADLARDLARERAAIMEYDGGLPRWQAEKLACAAHGLARLDSEGRELSSPNWGKRAERTHHETYHAG